MKTYFTFNQVSLEQVTSWFFKDAKDHQLPYYHNRKHFIITNSFKSGLDWRSNSEANKIRLLLSCFREKIVKHLKTSLLLGSPTLTEVHKMHVSFKEKKTNKTVSCSTTGEHNEAETELYSGVWLDNSDGFSMEKYWCSNMSDEHHNTHYISWPTSK